jgi:hypothetical protein
MNIKTVAINLAVLFLIGFATSHLQGRERIKTPMSQQVFYRGVSIAT